jgi:hypothetical protein
MLYRTFKRSATNFKEFARARKIPDQYGLTGEQAVARCDSFNDNRTPAQIKRGTKMEFEKQ